VKANKAPESLDDAYKRIMALKVDEKEAPVIEQAFALWRNKRLEAPKRISKKSCHEAVATWTASERERKKRKVIEDKPDNYRIVTTLDEWNEILALLRNEEYVAWDTETTGLDLYNDRIIGVNAYLPKANIDFYVPFGHIDPSDKDDFVEYG
jgi:DNA polymerase-1